MKKTVHPSHQMSKWRSTIVTLTETSRFGSIRVCEHCDGEHARTAAGEGIHDELLVQCQYAPEFLLARAKMNIVRDIDKITSTKDITLLKIQALTTLYHDHRGPISPVDVGRIMTAIENLTLSELEREQV